MLRLTRNAARPPHMAGHTGDVSMWTTETAEGARRVHVRCPHCDRVQTMSRDNLKTRFRWMRDAYRWMRAGGRLFR
jgi:phage terminase large subunit GpA-like protein